MCAHFSISSLMDEGLKGRIVLGEAERKLAKFEPNR